MPKRNPWEEALEASEIWGSGEKADDPISSGDGDAEEHHKEEAPKSYEKKKLERLVKPPVVEAVEVPVPKPQGISYRRGPGGGLISD